MKVDARFILKILLIILVLNCIILFFVDGPLWVFLCFTIWLNFMYILIALYFIFLINRSKAKKKTAFDKIKPKWQKLIRYGFRTVYIVLIVYFILLAMMTFPFVFNPVMHWKAEQNKAVLNDLVDGLTEDCVNDEEKTISLMNWFERHTGNINNIWGHPNFGSFIFGDGNPYSCIFCVRLVEREPPLWVLTSRCGACEELSVLFREMANVAGLSVRSVICHGIDHLWDEVLIEGKWVIVDPANVVFSRNM